MTDWKKIPDAKAAEDKQRELLNLYGKNPRMREVAPVKLDPKDPRGRAKLFAITLMEFLRTGQGQYNLTAEDVLFAVELNAMNLFNMEDYPLSFERRQQVRDDADNYYLASRPLAPPPPTRKR